MSDARRTLPGVSALLELDDVRRLLAANQRSVVVNAIRAAVAEARADISAAEIDNWGSRITAHVQSMNVRSLRPVINATGVVLHTNLGRAPLADAAIDAVCQVASGFTNLEYDLTTGKRGSRYVHCVALLRELTGAEDAIVVNNCASALVLALSAIARGRDVIVSRGELVEIGGSFRVPDIMGRSGANLVEVGTTNRTHLDDYTRAITSRTGAIAKIHRSNFALSGFVAEVSVRSLAPFAREHSIPIIHDRGSGLLIDLSSYGLRGEATARDALNEGADLVLMSGDKLLGGPQCGIVLGKRHSLDILRRDPFARAMRVDKMTIAALTATLELYRDPEISLTEIPALAMLTSSAESIRLRCSSMASDLAQRGITARVVESEASVGAGAFPTTPIPSFALAFDAADIGATERKFRLGQTPVIGRIADGVMLLDLRSVLPREDALLLKAIEAAIA